jgi:hypothetical protein
MRSSDIAVSAGLTTGDVDDRRQVRRLVGEEPELLVRHQEGDGREGLEAVVEILEGVEQVVQLRVRLDLHDHGIGRGPLVRFEVDALVARYGSGAAIAASANVLAVLAVLDALFGARLAAVFPVRRCFVLAMDPPIPNSPVVESRGRSARCSL